MLDAMNVICLEHGERWIVVWAVEEGQGSVGRRPPGHSRTRMTGSISISGAGSSVGLQRTEEVWTLRGWFFWSGPKLQSGPKLTLLELMWLPLDTREGQPWLGSSPADSLSISLLKVPICACTVHFFHWTLQHIDGGCFESHAAVPAAPGRTWVCSCHTLTLDCVSALFWELGELS